MEGISFVELVGSHHFQSGKKDKVGKVFRTQRFGKATSYGSKNSFKEKSTTKVFC